jgi:hypothetical protein
MVETSCAGQVVETRGVDVDAGGLAGGLASAIACVSACALAVASAQWYVWELIPSTAGMEGVRKEECGIERGATY